MSQGVCKFANSQSRLGRPDGTLVWTLRHTRTDSDGFLTWTESTTGRKANLSASTQFYIRLAHSPLPSSTHLYRHPLTSTVTNSSVPLPTHIYRHPITSTVTHSHLPSPTHLYRHPLTSTVTHSPLPSPTHIYRHPLTSTVTHSTLPSPTHLYRHPLTRCGFLQLRRFTF